LWGGVSKQEKRSVEHLIGALKSLGLLLSLPKLQTQNITTQVKDYTANQTYSPTATKGNPLMTKEKQWKNQY
jgi:hypothetical protein